MTVDSQTKIEYGFGTRAIHSGAPIDPHTGAVIEPISLSTTFAQLTPSVPFGPYEYSRSSNPNRDSFETTIASLEKAKYALAVSSGSAATALISQSLSPSLHIVSSLDVYGGTHRYFTKVASVKSLETSFVSDLESGLKSALRPNTGLVWLETPSNPTLKVTNISVIAEIVKQHNMDTGGKAILVVDNTFLSPYLCNPLVHGADVVVHSVTKYINGHSDVVMGVIATNLSELHDSFRFLQNALGCIPSPFDSWLAHRGLKTLHLRIKQASYSAQIIADILVNHLLVLHVNYPGLKTHPNYHVVAKQHRDSLGGGMISFRIKGGAQAANKFSSATRLFTLAESLGGIDSLVEVPAVMTHGGFSQQEREANGVYDDLIRISVGIEVTSDLVQDILQGLEVTASI